MPAIMRRSLFSRGSAGGGGGGSDMPAFSASNPDHVSHLLEDWSGYTAASQIGVSNRADGGGPWNAPADVSKLTLSTSGLDPYGGVKKVIVDYTAAPAAGSSEGFFVDLDQPFSPLKWLNPGTVKESFVIEVAFQYVGAPYIGKISDFQPTGGTDRLNLQSGTDAMGFHNLGNDPNPDTDPLTSLFYSNGGATHLFPNIPNWGDECFVINRTAQGDPTWPYLVAYPQNKNFGVGAGLFDTGGSGNSQVGQNLVGQGWYRFVQRFTLNAAGVAGRGRIEMWMQQALNAPVKVMEYYGDVGQLCAGQVRGRDTTQGSTWIATGMHWSIFNLTAVGGIYLGGCTLHVGLIRHWSHSRLAV